MHSVKSSSHSHVVGSFFRTVDGSKVAALIGFKVAGRCKLAKRVGTKALVLAMAKSKNAGRLLPIIMLDLVLFMFEEEQRVIDGTSFLSVIKHRKRNPDTSFGRFNQKDVAIDM